MIFVIVCSMWMLTGDEMRVASIRACLSFSLVYDMVGADIWTWKWMCVPILKMSIFLCHDINHIILMYCSTLSCHIPCWFTTYSILILLTAVGFFFLSSLDMEIHVILSLLSTLLIVCMFFPERLNRQEEYCSKTKYVLENSNGNKS